MLFYHTKKRGNAVIGIHIYKIKDMKTGATSKKCDTHSVIGYYSDNSSAYFDDIRAMRFMIILVIMAI